MKARVLWVVLAVAACAPKASLEDAPCPCATGWVCCPGREVCVAEEAACPALREDAGPASDAGAIDGGRDASVYGDGGIAPTSLSGVSLWLVGDLGVTLDGGTEVLRWADQSGHQHDAFAGGSEGHTRISGVLNGHDTLTGGYLVAQSASLDFQGQDFLVEEVLLPPWGGGVFGMGGNVFFMTADQVGQSVGVAPGTHVSSSVDLGSTDAHVLGMWRHGDTLELRVDGVVTSGTLTGQTFTGNVVIGDRDGSFVPGPGPFGTLFNGSIAEVVVAQGPFTAATVEGLELYLRARYGL